MIRRRHRARDRGDDAGSVLLLTLGYGMLALATVFVCVDATSLYLAQKRLDSVADAAALAAADGFALEIEAGGPVAILTDAGVQAQAAAIVADAGGSAVLQSASTPDGISARVTVSATWHPPVLAMFVPDGVALGSTATSRTALRERRRGPRVRELPATTRMAGGSSTGRAGPPAGARRASHDTSP